MYFDHLYELFLLKNILFKLENGDQIQILLYLLPSPFEHLIC